MAKRREHFGAIDVGTNAARVKIARVRDGRLEIVHAARAAVAPGQGLYERGIMAPAVVDRLCEAIGEFAEAARFHRAELRAVATSAMRTAKNRDAVVARIQKKCGVTLEVIDGVEEARLTALGVLAGRGDDERAVCIDVGGGSTEVVLGEGEEAVAARSVELGSARLQQALGDDVVALRAAAARQLRALERTLVRGWMGDEATAIGCSGSVRALVSFATADARRYVTRLELGGVIDELARMSVGERVRFFERRRAAVILPAAVILEQTMARLGVWAVRASRRGLRDGVLVELMRRARRERVRAA